MQIQPRALRNSFIMWVPLYFRRFYKQNPGKKHGSTSIHPRSTHVFRGCGLMDTMFRLCAAWYVPYLSLFALILVQAERGWFARFSRPVLLCIYLCDTGMLRHHPTPFLVVATIIIVTIQVRIYSRRKSPILKL